jgi:hypothetical protein
MWIICRPKWQLARNGEAVYGWLPPLPGFFVSVASKELRAFVSPFDATDLEHLTSVANKGLTERVGAGTRLLLRELTGEAGRSAVSNNATSATNTRRSIPQISPYLSVKLTRFCFSGAVVTAGHVIAMIIAARGSV